MSLSTLLLEIDLLNILMKYWQYKIDYHLAIILHHPNSWIETSYIQHGNLTTSNNTSTRLNIYATDGLVNKEMLDITTTSTFTNSITPLTVNLSFIEYSDSSGLDKLTINIGAGFELRD